MSAKESCRGQQSFHVEQFCHSLPDGTWECPYECRSAIWYQKERTDTIHQGIIGTWLRLIRKVFSFDFAST